MITKDGTIIINEWDTAIAESSMQGFADMRNCDPFRKPGYLELAPEMVNEADTPFSEVCTANAGTDLITLTSGSILRGNSIYSGVYKVVQFTTTGTLPAGLSLATNYFITSNGSLTNTIFNVSTSLANAEAGTFVDITDTGTGTHTCTSINIATPRYVIYDPTYRYFLQDSNGRIWNKTLAFWTLYEGNTTAGSSGNGLAIWQGYLIAFRNTVIDVALLSSKAWTNSFQSSMTSLSDHFPFVSGDGDLYFSNGKNVGALSELTIFDPSSGATYTYSDNVLDLEDTITCFGDLGNLLMIGTDVNKIYPWDRTSSSFSVPINLLESNVLCMKSVNNVLYFGCGGRGNIYRTYGTTAEIFIDISNEFSNTLQHSAKTSAIILTSNEILFYIIGVNQAITGIYAANLKTGAYHLKYKLSQGYAVSPYLNAVMGVTSSNNNDIIVGAYSTGGITYIDTTFFFGFNFSTATRYIAYAVTKLYEVGTFVKPRTFKTMQLILAAEMISGMGIKVSSRKNLTDSFTETATFDYATMADETAWQANINIEKAQFIQLKIEVQVSGSAPYTGGFVYGTPTIRSLIVE